MKPIQRNAGRYRYVVFAPPGWGDYPKRKPFYFESKAEAKRFCDELENWKRMRHGKLEAVGLSDSDKNWVGFLKNELGDLTILPQVVAHWKKTASLSGKTPAEALCNQFEAFQESKGLNVTTRNEIRSKLRKFALAFVHKYVHEITVPQLRDYLLTVPEGWSRKGAYKWLRMMFDFAKEQRMCAENPFDNIKAPPVRMEEPAIYTPSDFEKLLRTADGEFPELLPWLVLSGFNFCRKCELIPTYAGDPVMKWSDFLLDRGEPLLHIRPEVAKQTRTQSGLTRYPPVLEATRHWLFPLDRATWPGKNIGPVVDVATERQFQILKKRLFLAAGVEPVNNGLRHSCISYWIAKDPANGIATTAKWAGNSEGVSRRHYIKSLTPSMGEAWFGIRK